MPKAFAELCTDMASLIADYRQGEITPPDAVHVKRWIEQFPSAQQIPLLAETFQILKKTYFSTHRVESFISEVVASEKLAGDRPSSFWSDVGFLRLQGSSDSQRHFLKLLGASLRDKFGINTDRVLSPTGTYIYVDDGLFTGSQVRHDLLNWLEDNHEQKIHIHVIVIALHDSGHYWVKNELKKAMAGRDVSVEFWYAKEFHSWTKSERDVPTAQVLWPQHLPNDPSVSAWKKSHLQDSQMLTLRPSDANNPFFSSPQSRDLIEQSFFAAGTRIISNCTNPSDVMRPLGYWKLRGKGFGTMFCTYRNCPNNAPLALWWGNPNSPYPALNRWYPLLPRRIRPDHDGDF